MDINFKILQSKYFKKIFKINIHQNVSRAFNILHYNEKYCDILAIASSVSMWYEQRDSIVLNLCNEKYKTNSCSSNQHLLQYLDKH